MADASCTIVQVYELTLALYQGREPTTAERKRHESLGQTVIGPHAVEVHAAVRRVFPEVQPRDVEIRAL